MLISQRKLQGDGLEYPCRTFEYQIESQDSSFLLNRFMGFGTIQARKTRLLCEQYTLLHQGTYKRPY